MAVVLLFIIQFSDWIYLIGNWKLYNKTCFKINVKFDRLIMDQLIELKLNYKFFFYVFIPSEINLIDFIQKKL